MTDLSRIRVSDAERNGVIARLQHATAEGRLSLDELDVRIADALVARTWSELDLLVDDLPAPAEPEPEPIELDAEPLLSPMAARAESAAVLGMATLAIPISFYSAWGNVLGLAAVLLGVITLLMPGRLTPPTRAAILTGVVIGLLPVTFYIGLFLIIGI
jgi:hypothetical protein